MLKWHVWLAGWPSTFRRYSRGVKNQRQERVGYVLALLSASAFGTLAVSGRFAYADGVDVTALMALRFGLATLGFWLVTFVRKPEFPRFRTSLAIVALGAVVLATEVTLFFMGLHEPGMTAGLAETLFFIFPAWVVLMSAVAHRAWPQLAVLLAAAVALSGVALTAGDLNASAKLGVVYLLIASLLYGFYVTASGHLLQGVNPLAASTLMTSGAGASLVLFAIVKGGQYPGSAAGWLSVATAVAIGTFASYALLYAALERAPSPIVAILTTAEPLVAIGLGAALLGERLSVIQVLGGGLILLAVVGLLSWQARQTQKIVPEMSAL